MSYYSFRLDKRLVCAFAVVLALLAVLVLPAPAARAAAAPTTSTPRSNAGKSAPKTTAAPAALKATGAGQAKPIPRPRTRPSPTTVARPAAPAAAVVRTTRATAARKALARTTTPDTCSGAIEPDVVYPCDTPSAGGTDTFTVNLADATDLLTVQVLSTSGDALPLTVTAPDGSAVACSSPNYSQIPQCATASPGGYTVAVADQGSPYTISYLAVLSDDTCRSIDPSFAAGPLHGSVAAGAAGACFTLNVPSGHTVNSNTGNDASSYLEMPQTVYDATGAKICTENYGTCTLTGTGPYRVLLDQPQGIAFTYGLEVADLTDPAGCLAVAAGTYGVAPADTSSDDCREITVATPGDYQVYGATAGSGQARGTLYDSADDVACTNTGSFCDLSAGTYYYVGAADSVAPVDFAVVFIAANASSGCTATGDTDFATGPAEAAFAGPGEVDCLDLPTASGRPLYVYDENLSSTSSEAPLLVVDATGVQQCMNLYDSTDDSGVCTPTGTAPFRIIVAGSQWGGSTGYKVLVQATDSTAGCADWPQSGFGGSWGATVHTSVTLNVACLSIPAAQHSTAEMIDYADSINSEYGGISVNDSSGAEVCDIGTTGVCTYHAGVGYTVIVSNIGRDLTYDLVRRDITQNAKCGTPASTTMGGPSTGFNLTSALNANCYRISAATTDKLWFDVRAIAPYPAGAVLMVSDSAGALVCVNLTTQCQVTGYTDYQVIAIAYGYSGVTIPTHLDTWRVATAAGPAAPCAAHALSAADGWAPISGTLTESATAYCATVTYKAGQIFDLPSISNSPDGTPLINVFPIGTWNTLTNLDTGFCWPYNIPVQCSAPNTAGTAILLVSLDGAQSPAGYTVQGVCVYECSTPPAQATISAISPDSQSAGATNKVTVTGAHLNLATEVMLATEGNPVAINWISTPVSVNAAGTQLTVELDTSGVTPGTYDVMLDADYSEPTDSPGYLSGAYTVTAPPSVSSLVPVVPHAGGPVSTRRVKAVRWVAHT